MFEQWVAMAVAWTMENTAAFVQGGVAVAIGCFALAVTVFMLGMEEKLDREESEW